MVILESLELGAHVSMNRELTKSVVLALEHPRTGPYIVADGTVLRRPAGYSAPHGI